MPERRIRTITTYISSPSAITFGLVSTLAIYLACGNTEPGPASSTESGSDSHTDSSSSSSSDTETPSDTSEDDPDECIGVDPTRTRRAPESSESPWWSASWNEVRRWWNDDSEYDDSEYMARADQTGTDTGDSATDDSATGDSSTGDTETGDTSDTGDDTSTGDDDTSTGDDGDPCESDSPPAYCPGSPAPDWELKDYQPLSCGAGEVYGLEAFKGHVTLFAMLKGW